MAHRGYRLRSLARALRSGAAEWEGQSRAWAFGGAYRAAYRLGRAVMLLGAALVCLATIVGLWGLAVGLDGGW